MSDKNRNLEEIIKKIDITETMAENAESKYKAVARELCAKGLDVDIYPQGSFALGTVVRPFTEGKDVDYDLDFICEINQKKENSKPKEIKNSVGDVLINSGRTVREDDTCWIIDYANIQDNIGFKLDIVPAVQEESEVIRNLIAQGVLEQYANTALAITIKKNNVYNWGNSNAKGYTKWFQDINAPFLDYKKREKKGIFEASIEDVPNTTQKSNLQRVIQILKRHRDIYYYNIRENDKPSSAIITTLVARIGEFANPNLPLLELLEFIIKELNIYSKLQVQDYSAFLLENINKYTIKKEGKEWIIPNPVNPENNLAGYWTDRTANQFFKWIIEVNKDLVVSKDYDDEKYLVALKNGLGSKLIEQSLNELNLKNIGKAPVQVSTIKPWRKYIDE